MLGFSPAESWLECCIRFCYCSGSCSSLFPNLIYLTVQIHSVFISPYLCILMAMLSSCITTIMSDPIFGILVTSFDILYEDISINTYTRTNTQIKLFSIFSDIFQGNKNRLILSIKDYTTISLH